jgi:acetyl esterase/lipase
MTSVDVESFEGKAPAKPGPGKIAPRAAAAPVRPAAAPAKAAPVKPGAPKPAAQAPAAPAKFAALAASLSRPAKPAPRPAPAATAAPAPSARPAFAIPAVSAPPVAPPELDTDAAHMLALWRGMGGAGLETLTPEQARHMPPLAAAQKRFLREGDDPGVESGGLEVPGAAGRLAARLYRRRQNRPGLSGALIVHFGGGGFVCGSLDAADPVARALCRRSGAQVLSVETRRAPEHKFPAAHDDAMAVWRWIVAEAHAIGVEPGRIAVSGEGAGANLAFNVALGARLEKIARPVHAALITPIAGMTFDTPSHRQNAAGLPLGTPGVKWIAGQLLSEGKQAYDRRLALSMRPDLGAAPPTTLILAGADPLRSDAEALGAALGKSRVPLAMHLYEGMPHDFFGLFGVVNKAMFALSEVGFNLAEALGNGPGR